VGRQHRDVLPALPQRGDPDGDHVQPEVQVGPEPPLGDLLLEVLVGGGDDPHVHGDRLVPAHRGDRLLLEHPEQLHLQVGAHLADLVQEDGPVVGRLELSRPGCVRPRERPLDMAEQLALQELRGDGRAVDGDEHPVRARGKVMDGPGHELLPRAAFPGDQHRGVCVGHLLDQGEDLLDRVADADDVLQPALAADQGAKVRVLLADAREFEHPVDELDDLVDAERLRDVVERPHLHRVDGGFDRGVAGHEDHFGVGVGLAGVGQDRQPVRAGHLEVR